MNSMTVELYFEVLYLKENSPMLRYRPGAGWLESVARQAKEVILVYAGCLSLHTVYHIRFWAPQYEKDAIRLEQVQWRATKTRGWSIQQEKLCFVNPRRRWQRGDLIAAFNYLTGG